MIIGAGVVGLSIARELLLTYPNSKIVIIEKENVIGLHASGRNSGVLHSGIYYKQNSLKARLCQEGSRAMMAYCDEYSLSIKRIGKLIVPRSKADLVTLDILYERAIFNRAKVSLVDESQLFELEPNVRSYDGRAIFSSETSVVDPNAILSHLYRSLCKAGVIFYFNNFCTKVDLHQQKIFLTNSVLSYGKLYNAAGAYADNVAKACGLDNRYLLIPFKGAYYELSSLSSIQLNHLIYPVPDMNVPFLGVHFTKGVTGKIFIGPTAMPVLGREHYSGLKGIKFHEAWITIKELAQQYLINKQGFRAYTHAEVLRLFKSRFFAEAQLMVPGLQQNHLIKSKKVGIRAQLFDKYKRELVQDFLIEKTAHETHVLNAVSPAFTSAFSFAKLIVNGD